MWETDRESKASGTLQSSSFSNLLTLWTRIKLDRCANKNLVDQNLMALHAVFISLTMTCTDDCEVGNIQNGETKQN